MSNLPADVRPPRRHRALFWGGMLAAVVAVIAGGLLASYGWARTGEPGDVVSRYFAALARDDAPGALALGTVPEGSRELLNSQVLQTQLSVGQMHDIAVLATDRHGNHANVSVQYRLMFASGDDLLITDAVPVARAGHLWRLDRVAVPVQISVSTAEQRATLAGAAMPKSTLLAFPGAVPVTFDTPILGVDGRHAVIRFSAPGALTVPVTVSAIGQQRLTASVAKTLRDCLALTARDPLCPSSVSNVRTVPGTVHGTLTRAPTVNATVASSGAQSESGAIDVIGSADATLTYQFLDFNNIAHTARANPSSISFEGRILATQPDLVRWYP